MNVSKSGMFVRPKSGAKAIDCRFDDDQGEFKVSAISGKPDEVILKATWKNGLSLEGPEGGPIDDAPVYRRLKPSSDGVFRLKAADPKDCE